MEDSYDDNYNLLPGSSLRHYKQYNAVYGRLYRPRLPPIEDQQLVEHIIRCVNNRQYHHISAIIQRLTNIDRLSINLSLTTSVDAVKLLRDSGIKVTFNSDIDDLVRWRWQDIPNLVANSSSPLSIRLMGYLNNLDNLLIDYCQLANIPFELITSCIEPSHYRDITLVLDNVSLLNDNNKKTLAEVNGYSYLLRLLHQSGYPVEVPTRYTLVTFYKLLTWIPGINRYLDNVRESINDEDLYTNPSLWHSHGACNAINSYWKSLTPQQIIAKHFDPQHLINVGIKVPDVNLILNDIENVNILTFKRLLPYSNPSSGNIEKILNMINGDNQGLSTGEIIHLVILLVRYKRELMMEYQDNPFVEHLMNI